MIWAGTGYSLVRSALCSRAFKTVVVARESPRIQTFDHSQQLTPAPVNLTHQTTTNTQIPTFHNRSSTIGGRSPAVGTLHTYIQYGPALNYRHTHPFPSLTYNYPPHPHPHINIPPPSPPAPAAAHRVGTYIVQSPPTDPPRPSLGGTGGDSLVSCPSWIHPPG